MLEKHRIHFQSKLSDEASAGPKLGAQRSRPLTLGQSIHPGSPGKWTHSGRTEAWAGRRVNGGRGKLMRRECKNQGEVLGEGGRGGDEISPQLLVLIRECVAAGILLVLQKALLLEGRGELLAGDRNQYK